MKESQFIVILIFISISFSAFLSGYFITHKDLLGEGYTGGQILDRFLETPSPTSQVRADKPVALTSEPVISYALRGSSLRYVARNGQVFEIDTRDFHKKIVSNTIVADVVGVIWSPYSNSLIYSVGVGSSNKFTFLDLSTGKMKDLEYNIDSVAFSPDGDKIVYTSKVGEAYFIIIRQLNSSGTKKILSIRLPEPQLSWPEEDVLYIESSGDDNLETFTLTLDGHLKKIPNKEGGGDVDKNLVLDQSIQPEKIILSELGSYAVVQNYLDKRLYRVTLSP